MLPLHASSLSVCKTEGCVSFCGLRNLRCIGRKDFPIDFRRLVRSFSSASKLNSRRNGIRRAFGALRHCRDISAPFAASQYGFHRNEWPSRGEGEKRRVREVRERGCESENVWFEGGRADRKSPAAFLERGRRSEQISPRCCHPSHLFCRRTVAGNCHSRMPRERATLHTIVFLLEEYLSDKEN